MSAEKMENYDNRTQREINILNEIVEQGHKCWGPEVVVAFSCSKAVRSGERYSLHNLRWLESRVSGKRRQISGKILTTNYHEIN